MFAVIQTAATTPNADVVPYKDDDGNRVPAVLFMHADRAKCELRRKRLLRQATRIKGFKGITGAAVLTGTPVLGVCEVEIEEGVKRPRAKKPQENTQNGTAHSATNAVIQPAKNVTAPSTDQKQKQKAGPAS